MLETATLNSARVAAGTVWPSPLKLVRSSPAIVVTTHRFDPPRNLVLQHAQHRVELQVDQAALRNQRLQKGVQHDDARDGNLRHLRILHGDDGVGADQIRVAQPRVWVLALGAVSDEEVNEPRRIEAILGRAEVDLVEILGWLWRRSVASGNRGRSPTPGLAFGGLARRAGTVQVIDCRDDVALLSTGYFGVDVAQ
jgi:hypothetical protein